MSKITLPQGRQLTYQEAEQTVFSYVSDFRAVEFYDETNPGPHDDVILMDVLSLNALDAFAGTPAMNPMTALWNRRDKIPPVVRPITKDSGVLRNTPLLLKQIPLLDKALSIIAGQKDGWGPTRTAKLMHRLRPNVAPIWDVRVGDWYQGRDGTWTDFLTAVFSDVTEPGTLGGLESIQAALAAKKKVALTPIRIWDILLWSTKR